MASSTTSWTSRQTSRGAPPPPMQAFLAGASPQAQEEYAALQDAFPVGASEDVQTRVARVRASLRGPPSERLVGDGVGAARSVRGSRRGLRFGAARAGSARRCRPTKRKRRRRTPAARRRRGQGASSAGPRLARARRFTARGRHPRAQRQLDTECATDAVGRVHGSS